MGGWAVRNSAGLEIPGRFSFGSRNGSSRQGHPAFYLPRIRFHRGPEIRFRPLRKDFHVFSPRSGPKQIHQDGASKCQCTRISRGSLEGGFSIVGGKLQQSSVPVRGGGRDKPGPGPGYPAPLQDGSNPLGVQHRCLSEEGVGSDKDSGGGGGIPNGPEKGLRIFQKVSGSLGEGPCTGIPGFILPYATTPDPGTAPRGGQPHGRSRL